MIWVKDSIDRYVCLETGQVIEVWSSDKTDNIYVALWMSPMAPKFISIWSGNKTKYTVESVQKLLSSWMNSLHTTGAINLVPSI